MLPSRQRFRQRGRGFFCSIRPSLRLNPYALVAAMTSLWNTMLKSLELTRVFSSHFLFCFLFSYQWLTPTQFARLVCSALYNDADGERKYLPQFFKFVVANPLSVRTKVIIIPSLSLSLSPALSDCCALQVRVVKETTFLEACIENHTKANLFMDQVDFEPAKQWTALRLHDPSSQHPPSRSLPFSLTRSLSCLINHWISLSLSLCVSVILVE